MTESAPPSSIKETLTSIMIAFIVALIFRGFVVEGFQIPTGSMAPTLLGANIRSHSELGGYNWASEAWYPEDRGLPPQQQQHVHPTDPMTGVEIAPVRQRIRSGDRVFVFKYLEPMHSPQRWDVTVFKVPIRTSENYIKRLVGMPGEQLAMVDGDVFTRPLDASGGAPAGWSQSGWSIVRKPERVQRAVWQPVFDSQFAPRQSATFRSPVRGNTSGWTGLDAGPSYSYAGAGPTRLDWLDRVFRLDDYNAYNELPNFGQRWDRSDQNSFPVSDLSVSFGIEPADDARSAAVLIETRGHRFRAMIERTGDGRATASVALQPISESGDDAQWTTLDSADVGSALVSGRVTNVDFWHVDQALWMWVDGHLVAGGPQRGAYDWDIAQRLRHGTGEDLAVRLDADTSANVRLIAPSFYSPPRLAWEFDAGSFAIHRLAVKRDLFYRPTEFQRTSWMGDPSTTPGRPGLGTHPASPLILGPDQFFFCGDNSARSLDGRSWGAAHPAMHEKYPTPPGVVHRNMLIGRAFVVYLPGPERHFGLPIFDFGRMRWIW